MQAAKKLVLLDEFDREYKRLQRPTSAVVKTDRSLRLSNTLRDTSLADDRKVREYVGALHRYLNVDKRRVEPDESEETRQPHANINWLSEPEPSTPRQPVPLPRQREQSLSSSGGRRKKKARRKHGPRNIQWTQYGHQR